MESVVRTGYNMGFKKTRLTPGSKVEKALQKIMKRKIQKLFWEKLRLSIDVPRACLLYTSDAADDS